MDNNGVIYYCEKAITANYVYCELHILRITFTAKNIYCEVFTAKKNPQNLEYLYYYIILLYYIVFQIIHSLFTIFTFTSDFEPDRGVLLI